MLKINKNYKDPKKDEWDARTFEVGDILDASFVYSAKIPHFFKITRRTASTIWAVELGQKITRHDGYGQNGYCVPVEDEIKNNGKEVRGKINKNHYLKLNNSTAHLWDGEEVDFYTD